MLERDKLKTGTCKLVWTYGGGSGGAEASPELGPFAFDARVGLDFGGVKASSEFDKSSATGKLH